MRKSLRIVVLVVSLLTLAIPVAASAQDLVVTRNVTVREEARPRKMVPVASGQETFSDFAMERAL